jgi:hypothetical protein
MNVVNKKSDRNSSVIRVSPLLLAHQFVVKLYEEQSLILHCCEQVVFADEIKDIWPS